VSANSQTGRASALWPFGLLWRAAAFTAASLALSRAARGHRKRVIAAGMLGLTGSLCLRFAVHYGTNASARDPRAAFHQQRRIASSPAPAQIVKS